MAKKAFVNGGEKPVYVTGPLGESVVLLPFAWWQKDGVRAPSGPILFECDEELFQGPISSKIMRPATETEAKSVPPVRMRTYDRRTYDLRCKAAGAVAKAQERAATQTAPEAAAAAKAAVQAAAQIRELGPTVKEVPAVTVAAPVAAPPAPAPVAAPAPALTKVEDVLDAGDPAPRRRPAKKV